MASEDSDSDQELYPIPDQTVSSAFNYEDPLLVTGVLRAVVEGDLDKVKTLISQGRSPNINDNNGNTPLHVAVIKNQPEIVDYLLSLEETAVNSRNFCGETALFQAVKRGDLHVLEKLIKANGNVNLPDLQEITPLHLSVNEPEIARVLIQNGANLNALDYTGETPLHYAVSSSSCIEVVCMFLYFNADANIECNLNITPFMKSIFQERLEIQEILLDYVVDFNTTTREGNTMLNLALVHTCPYVETIIDRGADVNYTHDTLNAFQVCLRSPNVDKFRLIWKTFKHQETQFSYPNMLVRNLNKSDLYQYLRVIIDSDNLKPFFKCFELDSLHRALTDCSDKENWLNIIYELVFLYLSHGYTLTHNIMGKLYNLFGYNEHFYICLHMDIEEYTLDGAHSSIDFILCHPEKPVECFKEYLLAASLKNIIRQRQSYGRGYFDKVMVKEFLPHLRFCSVSWDSTDLDVLISQVPSLLELARNTARDVLVEKFKLFKPKQYFFFIDNMPVPKVIKHYLTFRKPIYAIEME